MENVQTVIISIKCVNEGFNRNNGKKKKCIVLLLSSLNCSIDVCVSKTEIERVLRGLCQHVFAIFSVSWTEVANTSDVFSQIFCCYFGY